jgi:hypothetical protein
MPVSTGIPSYIMAEVHSSYGGEYDSGDNLITLADCHRSVELEFFLGHYAARKQSLAKIDLLLKILTGFRDALQREAKLIADANRTSSPRTTKKPRAAKS